MSGEDRIEVLGVDLLERYAARADEFRSLSRELRVPIGWHYLLDFIWVSTEVEPFAKPGGRILDAGAGNGLMQWWLADRGVEVISLDRLQRSPSRRLRARYQIRPLTGDAMASLRTSGAQGLLHARSLRSAAGAARDVVLGEPAPPSGPPVWYGTTDLGEFEYEPESVDAVVGISSLEHNTPERLATIVPRLLGAVRPGGVLAATVMGANDQDWFHEPSQGWCMTEATLRTLFGLAPSAPSNYEQWNELFAQLRESQALREELADLYFASGDNGMPWGRWDPQYQTVGVAKWKPAD